MVSPAAKRRGVQGLRSERSYSERSACEVVGIARSSARYQSREGADETELVARIRELANGHKEYGYRRITALLRREGSGVNKKRVHRIWQEEGLQLPRRRPRKRRRGPPREVIQKAERMNHVWSYDIVEDWTERGRKIRILAVVDEYTRESLALRVERSIRAATVIETLDWLFLTRGGPEYIRSDNGPEFIAEAVQGWLGEKECGTIYIEPGSPWENPYIESFNGKLREECLNRYAFANVREARQIIEAWRVEYNTYRPHSSLGYLTPAEFATHTARLLRDAACTSLVMTEQVMYPLTVGGTENGGHLATTGTMALRWRSNSRGRWRN